ncbi:WD40-repeat-containing domain protein [Crassisporium funariophilum]|nr:WD40-repeat-containing domain protein [Crassisporium funariophilum]
MAANNSPLILPVVTIQNTFPEVIHEVQEGLVPLDKFWVSCYKTSEPSVHAKVRAELDEVDRNLVNLTPIEGDVVVVKDANGDYTVACKPLGVPATRVVTPAQEYKDKERSNPIRPHRITAFDVSPDSSRFATGYLDGSVFLYPATATHSPSHSLIAQQVDITNSKTPSRPHLSSVSSLKFFPSSRVILSSGHDFSLTILPADLPDVPSRSGTRVAPVRTLRAHTRPISGTAIIGLGRNVISSSLDRTVKLWEVSSGDVISSLVSQSPITSMSIGDRMSTPPDGEESPVPVSGDGRELPETSSKVVFCSLENGSFEVFDLGFKKSIYQSPLPASSSPLTSINYSFSHNLLATGSASGIITLYDTRSLGTPLTSFSRLETVVEDLAFLQNGSAVGLAIATADGLPYVASVIPEGPAVSAELVGVDCDPVRRIRVRDNSGRKEIWSASDDGIVRRYVL